MRHAAVAAALALAASVAGPGSALEPAAGARPGVFVVDEARSTVHVHVGKSGAFSFAGHRHEITAPVSGSIRAEPASLEASAVELRFAAGRFRVLPEGEPAGDAAKVEEVMLGPRVLDAARFVEVVFRSRRVAGRPTDGAGARYELSVTGELTIHGVTRELVVPVTVSLEGGTLRAEAHCTIRHEPFGLTPVTAAGGTVRVKDEIPIDFTIVAERRP